LSRQPWTARERWLVALLVLVALVARAWTVEQYEQTHPQAQAPVIDERSYDQWARAIAAGDWIGEEVYFQEPLYPYWLACVYKASGGSRSAARYAQAVLGALTVLLVYALARALAGARAAAAAALLLALYPPHWHLATLLLKENLFLPCVAAVAWLGLCAMQSASKRARIRAWIGVGALAGAGALLRGNMLLLLPLVVAWPLVAHWSDRRHAAARAALVLGGALLVLLPVAVRNWHVGRVFALTTSGAGTNVYGGNNAHNRYGVATEFPWVRGIPEHEAADWKHEAERRVGHALSPTEVSSYWLGAAWASLRADPKLHARIFWNKLRLTLGPYEVPDNHCLAWDARYVPLLRTPLPGFALLGWLGLLGALSCAWRLRARDAGEPPPFDARAACVLGLGALGYLATIVLTVTSDRVRLGLVPLLAPFAGCACVSVVAIARRPWSTLVCAAVAASCAWLHAMPAREREDDLLERDYNQASYWVADPAQRVAARTLAESLDAARPNSSRVLILLAELDWRAGKERLDAPGARADPERREHALASYQSALDRLKQVLESQAVSARERFRAQRLAGLIQLDLRRYDAAERRFREALAFDPADAEMRVWLGQCLLFQAEHDAPGAREERAKEALACFDGAPWNDAALEDLRERARALLY
jgi:4-amino-4-deoxy-L-arabinose transferase-like glycosyltransferase